MSHVTLILFRMSVNWLILDGPHFVISKGEKPIVELVIMLHQKFSKDKGMIKLLIYGALESSHMSLWQEKPLSIT